jgi:anti-sigma B factor antagonist
MGTFDLFEVRVERRGSQSTLLLRGEFDLHDKEAFEHAVEGERRYLAQRRFASLVVDLSELRFMDSSGLGCLLNVWNESRQDGFQVHFVRATGTVQRLLELTRVDEILPFVEAGEPCSSAEVE